MPVFARPHDTQFGRAAVLPRLSAEAAAQAGNKLPNE